MSKPLFNLNSPGHPVWRITNLAKQITKFTVAESAVMKRHNEKKLKAALIEYRDKCKVELAHLDRMIAAVNDDHGDVEI